MDTKLQTDTSDPLKISAINEFYENNLSSIVKLDSPTLSNSSTKSDENNFNGDDSSSTVASDSDLDEVELRQLPSTISEQIKSSPALENNDKIILAVSNGNSSQSDLKKVSIENSTDIQFGNRTFYNGPVTIKQFMLDEQQKKWILRKNSEAGGIPNRSFVSDEEETPGDPQKNKTHEKDDRSDTAYVHPIKSFCSSWKKVFCTVFLLIIITVLLMAVFKSIRNVDGPEEPANLSNGEESRKHIAINSTIAKDRLPGTILRLITRDEWLAQPTEETPENLTLPVGRVIISHTATEACETQAACTLRVRRIQTFHIEGRKWNDIAYNFLIGGDGSVYEGRGWDHQGAHTLGYNIGSIGISYIGTFNKVLPNDRQISAGFLLMKQGVELGKLKPDYAIYGHRQLAAFESPGAAFFELIKTWKHWKNEI